MSQVEALKAGASEDAAILNAEIQRLSAELIVVTQDSKYAAEMSKQEKQKLLKNIERLSQQLDVSQAELASGKVKISDLEAALAKKDVDLEGALALADDLQEQLDQALADANAAKQAGKKFEGDLGNLHTLYLALSGVDKILDYEGNVTADVEQARSTGNIAGALDAATNTKALDKYNRIRKTFKTKGFDVPADERADMIKDFSDEMSKGFDAVAAAVEKGGAVQDDGAERAYFSNKKRKYPHAPFPADSALEKKFAKKAEARRKDRERKRKKRLQAWKTNDGNLLIERWQKLAGLK